MEETERYVIGEGEDISIADNDRKVMFTITTKKLQDLLNQQNKRIKELEDEKKELEIKLDKCGTELVNAESLVSNLEEVQFDYKKENQQLKQQLHDLPKKIVEEIKNELLPELSGPQDYEEKYHILTVKILDIILKNYGGK